MLLFCATVSSPSSPRITTFSLLLLATTLLAAVAFDDLGDDPFSPIMRLEALQKRRGRELFGKRSGGPLERQSRRTRELFGKRAAAAAEGQQQPTLVAAELVDYEDAAAGQRQMPESLPIVELAEFMQQQKRSAAGQRSFDEQALDSAGLGRFLAFLGHQRARRARGMQRELFG